MSAPRVAVAVVALCCSCASEPPAAVVVTAVEALGVMEKPPAIDGRDGGTSGLYRGRSVWVYGDSVATMQGTFPSTWRNNTMSWTADLDGRDGITGFVQPLDALGAAREFFPRTPAEQTFNTTHDGPRYAIWGSGPVADAPRDRALLVYGKVYSEPGDFKFSILGTSIATWDDFDAGPTRPPIEPLAAGAELLFDAVTEGEYGIPAVSDGFLYLFSCSGGPSSSRGCRLARAPLDAVLRRASWEFRTDRGWSTSAASAVSLFDGSPNMTVHWNPHVGRWLAVYLSGAVVMRTAPRLEGPWSRELTVYQPSESEAMHALAHAEYQADGGAVEYVSYLANRFQLLRVHLAPLP